MSFMSDLANVAKDATHNVEKATEVAVSKAVDSAVKAAAVKINNQLLPLQAQLGVLLSNIRSLESRERELETAINVLTQQLKHYADQAGVALTELLK